MFKLGQLTGAAGTKLSWKIECDDLSSSDWKCIAFAAQKLLPAYGAVVGVPRGGMSLACEMDRFVTSGPILIVDDVWTTGYSMRRTALELDLRSEWIGFVAFARGKLDRNVTALFHMNRTEHNA